MIPTDDTTRLREYVQHQADLDEAAIACILEAVATMPDLTRRQRLQLAAWDANDRVRVSYHRLRAAYERARLGL